MKTRLMIKNLSCGLVFLFLMMLSATAHSQACPGNKVALTIQNITTGSNYVEYDLYLQNTGSTSLKLAAFNGNVRFTGMSSAGTMSMVTQPAATGNFNGFADLVPAYLATNNQLKWTETILSPSTNANLKVMAPGVDYKFARFRYQLTTAVANATPATLFLPTSSTGGIQIQTATVYCGQFPDPVTYNTNSIGLTFAASTLTISATQNITLPPDATCAIAGAVSGTSTVACFGGTSPATITLTGASNAVPNPLTFTYTVDGGSSAAVTANAGGAFTITGLAVGTHSVVVTSTSGSCTTPVTVPVTISGPAAPLTNSTPVTACDTYTWSVTGQAYTTSGTYTGTSTNGNGCTVNETLVLTINHSDAHTTNATACDTYTWAAPLGNGTAYTTSGTYTNTSTNASGCSHVETLVLTINHSDAHTTNATACDTYTWAGPIGNGTAYTTSGTYTSVTTNASGCNHTETLVLVINHSDAHTTTTSACDTYTWAAPLGNGTVYTASGTYMNSSVNASGCSHTETLVLTINHSSTTTDTQVACNTYTWPVNGQTYTASGTYTANNTNASGCPNVATLNLTINTSTTPYYTDADGDGYGTGTAIFSCTGQPAGTALVSGDCAPNDPAKWRTANLYVDADNDGYYNGNPETTAVCYGATLPTGYTSSIIGTDCNDGNAEVNPNHVEVASNTIDDNCDGTVDEAGPVIALVPSQCGTTLANIANTIYAQQSTGAEGYRFEVTSGASVRTYDSATNSFSLLSLTGGAAYATTYTIRVAVKTSGFWRQYSAPCTITTPAAAATTNVIASQCGTTLANIDTVVYVNQVTSANQYRYELTDTANTSNVRTYDSGLNRFQLSNFSGGGAFGATYSVRVALRFGTTWEPYGTACNISMPSAPGVTGLQASQCGITISNRWTTIYATQVPAAQGYRFRVTNGASVIFVDRTVNNFALAQIGGGNIFPNTVYTVDVAVLYNSVYGAYGPACTLTTAGVVTRHADAPVAIFDVKSYPNPFADTFRLDINTSGEGNVGVKVYDMIGKLVESREISVSELGTVEVGSRYSSGVYNVIVSQGENVQTLRVIKR